MQHLTAISVCAAVLCAALTGCTDPPVVPIGSGTAGPGTTTGVDGVNHPPELHKIGNKVVVVGSQLKIEPKATDIDNNPLTFSAYGVPANASWSSSPPRFTWTPDEFTKPVSLTFIVSDGLDLDRENVEVEVATEAGNHPPSFQPVGDQVIEVGQNYLLQLQASDPDGDKLIFAAQGPVPPDAVLDVNNGTFGWTPGPNAEQSQFDLVFSVTDGQANATLPIKFFVIAPGQNKPPWFDPVPLQLAPVGEPYTLNLSAHDPEGDSLSFGVEGEPPDGSTFDPSTGILKWVPSESQIGTHSHEFWVTDGQYKSSILVDIEVPAGQQGECSDDVNEPNNSVGQATPITTGNYENLSLCDTVDTPVDVDYFVIGLASGQALSVEVTFATDVGDIDVHVVNQADPTILLAKAESTTDNEALTFPISEAGSYVIRIFGTGQAVFKSPYKMVVSTAGLSCIDDAWEPNGSFQSATPMTPGDAIYDAQYCPNNLDFYTFNVSCGASVTAAANFDHTDGNLDLYFYRETDPEEPAVSATGSKDVETIFFNKAPLSEKVYLLVKGDPPESTLNSYDLTTQVTGSAPCTSADDDIFEPNDSKKKATQLIPPSDSLANLKACCSQDWFFVPMKQGEGLLVAVKFDGASDTYRAKLYQSDAKTLLAEGEPDSEGLLVTLPAAEFSGNHYLVVEGEPGTDYSIEIVVVTNAGCTSTKGCPGDEICVTATGSCVSDFCNTQADCPQDQEMPCEDFHCLAGCTYDADCKLDWSCKGFSFGKYCGKQGTKATGEACFNSSACVGADSCYFKEKGGYCTNIGCTSNAQCSGTADCVEFTSTTLCASQCTTNDDCRAEDGFTCQPKTLPNGIPTNVCLPIP